MVGAVLAFASVTLSALRGLRAQLTAPREQGPEALFVSAYALAVGLSIGATALVCNYVGGYLGWQLTGFVSTIVYLLVLEAESTADYLFMG